MTVKYDAVIIGAGPGGYSTALRIAQLGGKVAIVERDMPGGVCATVGCIPTKALLKFLRNREPGDIDFKELNRVKNASIRKSVKGVEFLLKQRRVDFFHGTGKIKDIDLVEVLSDKRMLEIIAENIVIATGTSPADIPPARIDGRFVLSSDDVLEQIEPTKSLVIIGGGVVGVEFASIFNRLGADVTIVEMMPQLIPSEDEEVAELLRKSFEHDGIHVFTGSRVNKVYDGTVQFTGEEDETQRLETEKVLLAVGRVPNVDVEEMESLGVELEKGFIKVNEYMQTSVKGIYAVGDVTGKSMLAHAAYFQGRAVAETIMGGLSRADHKLVPICIYSIPEVSSIGLDYIQGRDDLYCVKVPYWALASALLESPAEGFIKVWHDGWRLHAVTVIGQGAPEIISLASIGLQYGGDLHVLKNAMIPHPSLSEIFSEAIYSALREEMHTI